MSKLNAIGCPWASLVSRLFGVAVQDVGEEPGVEALPLVVGLGVAHHRAARDVERPDAGVHDAFGAARAAGERQLAAVGVVVVDAAVDLRLRRAGVGERRVGAAGAAADLGPIARNGAGRPAHRILRIAARGDLERPAIVDRRGVRAADVPQRAGITAVGAVEAAEAGHRGGALHLARRLGDHVDHAVERVRAPHRRGRSANHFDLLHLVQVHRQEIPHHEPEEILIQTPAVEQRQLAGRQRAGRAAAGDVDVPRRDLRDVDAGNAAQQLGEVLGRRVLDRHAGDHAHRGRRVDQRLLGARRR